MYDLTGKIFTRLKVIELVRINKKPFWKCICTCMKEVITTTTALNAGHKKSCGCLLRDTREITAKNMGKKNEQNLNERFFKYVNKLITGKKCWEWIGDIGIGGYGRIWYKGKTNFAHRVSYLKHIGKIPKGTLVCHTCDNPKCVNPDHLFLGTEQNNYDDMVSKGRRKKVPNSKKRLTEYQVICIRKLLDTGELLKNIAVKFSVSIQTISSIKNNRTWKNIRRG